MPKRHDLMAKMCDIVTRETAQPLAATRMPRFIGITRDYRAVSAEELAEFDDLNLTTVYHCKGDRETVRRWASLARPCDRLIIKEQP